MKTYILGGSKITSLQCSQWEKEKQVITTKNVKNIHSPLELYSTKVVILWYY